jgi:hypothetical protein
VVESNTVAPKPIRYPREGFFTIAISTSMSSYSFSLQFDFKIRLAKVSDEVSPFLKTTFARLVLRAR